MSYTASACIVHHFRLRDTQMEESKNDTSRMHSTISVSFLSYLRITRIRRITAPFVIITYRNNIILSDIIFHIFQRTVSGRK